MTLPYFAEMTDAELRAAYVDHRTALYNWSNLANSTRPKTAAGRKVAGGMGRNLRAVEIIEAIARKRGISLRVTA